MARQKFRQARRPKGRPAEILPRGNCQKTPAQTATPEHILAQSKNISGLCVFDYPQNQIHRLDSRTGKLRSLWVTPSSRVRLRAASSVPLAQIRDKRRNVLLITAWRPVEVTRRVYAFTLLTVC